MQHHKLNTTKFKAHNRVVLLINNINCIYLKKIMNKKIFKILGKKSPWHTTSRMLKTIPGNHCVKGLLRMIGRRVNIFFADLNQAGLKGRQPVNARRCRI